MHEKGRPRPKSYQLEVEPRAVAVVLRTVRAHAAGVSPTRIVRMLDEEGIPERIRSAEGGSPATLTRILENAEYTGR